MNHLNTFDTVASIRGAREHGGDLGGDEVIQTARWLSCVFPRIDSGLCLSSLASAYIAKTLGGGYADNPKLGISTGDSAQLLINGEIIRQRLKELDADTSELENIF